MAGIMDMFGGAMFGDDGGGYGDLLNEQQRKRMQQQATMMMAARLLQAGGRSDKPTSLGQALGGAVLSGQEAYNNAGQNAVQQALMRQKMDEYKAGQARQAAFSTYLQGQGGGQTPSPASITLGSTPQASTPGMASPAGMPAAGGSMLSPEQMQLMQFMSPEQQQKTVFDAASDRETFGNPITEMGENNSPIQVSYGRL